MMPNSFPITACLPSSGFFVLLLQDHISLFIRGHATVFMDRDTFLIASVFTSTNVLRMYVLVIYKREFSKTFSRGKAVKESPNAKRLILS